jgi:hypothetical protein
MNSSETYFSKEFIEQIQRANAYDAINSLYHHYQEEWQRTVEPEGIPFYESRTDYILQVRALLLGIAENHGLKLKIPAFRMYDTSELAKFDTYMHQLLEEVSPSRVRLLAESYERGYRELLAVPHGVPQAGALPQNLSGLLQELRDLIWRVEHQV